jgi:hypothetical protein
MLAGGPEEGCRGIDSAHTHENDHRTEATASVPMTQTRTTPVRSDDSPGRHMLKRCMPGPSERKRFSHPLTVERALDHLVKKSQEVRQVDPKSTIQAAGIDTTIEQRVMPLDHHEPLAFQTMHKGP